jgi:hypothetical protein
MIATRISSGSTTFISIVLLIFFSSGLRLLLLFLRLDKAFSSWAAVAAKQRRRPLSILLQNRFNLLGTSAGNGYHHLPPARSSTTPNFAPDINPENIVCEDGATDRKQLTPLHRSFSYHNQVRRASGRCGNIRGYLIRAPCPFLRMRQLQNQLCVISRNRTVDYEWTEIYLATLLAMPSISHYNIRRQHIANRRFQIGQIRGKSGKRISARLYCTPFLFWWQNRYPSNIQHGTESFRQRLPRTCRVSRLAKLNLQFLAFRLNPQPQSAWKNHSWFRVKPLRKQGVNSSSPQTSLERAHQVVMTVKPCPA